MYLLPEQLEAKHDVSASKEEIQSTQRRNTIAMYFLNDDGNINSDDNKNNNNRNNNNNNSDCNIATHY
jgi:hypothetical protein